MRKAIVMMILAVVSDSAMAEKDGAEIKPGQVFKDCTDCPEMVVIPAGSFEMGSNAAKETPKHRVTIIRAFAMGKTEVTQAQWVSVMGNNPSYFNKCGGTCPVETVSWNEAKTFIQKLNAKTGKQYRLPSEAEWEYAARAGSSTDYPWGVLASHEYANYSFREPSNIPAKKSLQERDRWDGTAPVGSFPDNAFGLFDMIGNVWEWVEDTYRANYDGAPSDGSAWQGDGKMRVHRGGSWNSISKNMRVSKHDGNEPELKDSDVGFRLASTLGDPSSQSVSHTPLINPVVMPTSNTTLPIPSESAASKLRVLNELYKEGVINQKDFETKKQEILKSM